MAISFDKAEEIPEGLKAHAKQDASGRFVLQAMPEGWGIEDIGGLKRTVSELRNESKAQAKALAAFEGLAPESAAEAREALEKFKAGTLKGSKELDEYKLSIEKKMADDKAKLDARLSARTAKLRDRMLRGDLAPVVASLGGSDSMDAILTLAAQSIRIEEVGDDLKASIVDRDGKPRVTKKGGSADPMGYEELIVEMREAPSTRGLFKTQGSGGAGSSSQTGGAGRAANPGQELSARELLARAHAEGNRTTA